MSFNYFESMSTDTDELPCKGLYYRCKVNTFLNAKGEYVHQERMVLLKRMSCSGCPQCLYLKDELRESVDPLMDKPPAIDDAIHERIYILTIVNVGYDPETGIVDDWDIGFVLQPPEKSK